MGKTKHINYIMVIVFTIAISVLFSCRKDPSVPVTKAVATGPAITIQGLRTMWAGMNIKFTSNTILNVVVTADENSGQLYKQVYVRDNSGTFIATKNYGAISLHFTHGTGGFLNQGDSIAVNLNGVTLDMSGGGSLQLDSIQATTQVVHLKSGLNPQPIPATIPQLYTYTGGQFIYDAQLVQLHTVEFISSNLNTTYAVPQAPPAAPVNVNKYVCDSAGNTIVAYNSGYANFAGITIPNNSGTIIAVANLYTTMQLSIRSDINGDINLNNAYNTIMYDTITQNFAYGALASKNNVATAGWKIIAYKGSLNWQAAQYGVPPNWKYSPTASNYKTTDPINDMWLISPPIIDHGGSYAKKMDFSTALQYGTTTSKRCLSVLVSRTFDGTNIIPTQWQDISVAPFFPSIATTSSNGYPSFVYASGSGFSPNPVPFTISGSSSTFYVAFRYRTNTNYIDSTAMSYLLGKFILRN